MNYQACSTLTPNGDQCSAWLFSFTTEREEANAPIWEREGGGFEREMWSRHANYGSWTGEIAEGAVPEGTFEEHWLQRLIHKWLLRDILYCWIKTLKHKINNNFINQSQKYYFISVYIYITSLSLNSLNPQTVRLAF